MLQILVPTDFSDNSYNALFYAVKLFEGRDCTFHILNTYDLQGRGKTGIELKKESMDGLKAIQHRVIRDLGTNNHHKFNLISKSAALIDGVNDFLQQNQVDYMVIGNKGKDQIKDVLFGNNAMQLIRETETCPILVVPMEIDFTKPDKIAFISDYRHVISESSVKVLQELSVLYDSAIIPMTIEDKSTDKDSLRNKKDFYGSFSTNLSKEVNVPVLDNKTNTILEFVEQWDIDMICMVYYPHHFFLEFIGKAIIKELSFKLRTPFLILPNTKID